MIRGKQYLHEFLPSSKRFFQHCNIIYAGRSGGWLPCKIFSARVVYTTKIGTMTTCTKSMNIYYSQVTLLLQCFIFLFKPIYKNIYLRITKLDIFESCLLLERTSTASTFFTLHADISVMAVSKVCTPSSKYFVVKRPPGSKVQDFTNRFCFHSSKTLHDHLVL